MKVYVFGNEDVIADTQAIVVAGKLSLKLPKIQFVFVKPNEDLPFVDEQNVVLIDAVMGLDNVTLIAGRDLDKLMLPPRTSAHDFDLGFQLKYLKKLGKLGDVKIIGLPMGKALTDGDYDLIHSILKKFVAQDIQGS